MLRDQFLLDPQIVFLNHGSFGACPRPVFERYQAWQRHLELQPVKFLGRELDDYLYQARSELGKYVNAPPGELVFIPNATHGVNIIARSLQLNPGDEILTTDQEYGACDLAWEFISKKTGAIYHREPLPLPASSENQIVEQFWQTVSDKTKIIYISHITSPTAITLPIQQICQRAREAGILTVIDGAHAPGQLALDLSALNADFYVGNCHKWMLSPKGAGFLYARPAVQDRIEPLIVSWGYQSRSSTPRETRFVDYLQWSGTHDPAAALSVPAAIEFMQENHWEDVRRSCHSLLRDAMERISRITGLPSLYPFDSKLYQQMGTVPIPRVKDLNELKNRLYEEYKIEIPCMEWRNQHFLRLSVQGYNTSADIDRLVSALSELLPDMIVDDNAIRPISA